MIQRTVEEQQRALYWHRRRQREKLTSRNLLRESDELMYWLEECLVQGLRIVPGWVMPRLVAVLSQADPELPRQLGRERRPAEVMEYMYRAQEQLMEQSLKARRPAPIIPLFRRRR